MSGRVSALFLGLGLLFSVGAVCVFLADGAESTAAAGPAAKVFTFRDSSDGDETRWEMELRPASGAVAVGVNHEWSIVVAASGEEELADCRVWFDATMPEHGHGLPTAPRVQETAEPGRFRVEGVRFSMPGHWVLAVKSSCGSRERIARFDLRL